MASEEDVETPLMEPDAADLDETLIVTAATGSVSAAATTLHTSFIIVSIYVGLGLLSQPYAIKLGGWTSLGLLVITAALFYTSAIFLGKACDLLPEGEPRSLPGLGTALWGDAGRNIVTFVAGLELFGSLIISLVVVLQQIELFLPTEGLFNINPMDLAVIITSAVLIPTLLLRDMSHLAPLAIIGSTASACVVLAVLSLLALDLDRSKMPLQPPPGHNVINWPVGMLQSIGIFSVSMSGHSTLPAVRQAMRHPERFPSAVAGAFGAIAAAYILVAGVGYWYWGDGVSAIAIFDLTTNSPFTRSVGGYSWQHLFPIDRFLGMLVLANCCAKIPALTMVIQELILGTSVVIMRYSAPRWEIQYMTRIAIAIGAGAVSLAARHALGTCLSLVGGICSITISLVLPLVFYTQLSWDSTKPEFRGVLLGLTSIGMMLLLSVTASNVGFFTAADASTAT